MYAVIRVGGKQQRVKSGDVIEAEYQKGEEPGATMTFRPILVVDDEGRAHHGKELERASVSAKILGEQKGEKVKVFKYRPKTRYSRRQGHRQMLSLLEIGEVSLGDGATAKAAKKAAAKPPAKSSARPARAKSAERPQEEPGGGEVEQPEGPGEGGSSATNPAEPTPDQAEGEREDT